MGVSLRVLVSVVAIPWSLSDLATTDKIHGLEPAPVLCTTPIKVSEIRHVTLGEISYKDIAIS